MGCCTVYRHNMSIRSRHSEAIIITNFQSRPILKLSRNFTFDIHQYKLSSILEVTESLEDSPVKSKKQGK